MNKLKKNPKKLFPTQQFKTIFEQNFFNLKPLLSTSFPQGFQISKNIGHPTLEKGQKDVVILPESEHTNTQTHKHTHRQTFKLIERIGPEGRCF